MVRVRCIYWGDFVDSEVHVFPSCKRYCHCTHCTVSPYNSTHVSFMASGASLSPASDQIGCLPPRQSGFQLGGGGGGVIEPPKSGEGVGKSAQSTGSILGCRNGTTLSIVHVSPLWLIGGGWGSFHFILFHFISSHLTLRVTLSSGPACPTSHPRKGLYLKCDLAQWTLDGLVSHSNCPGELSRLHDPPQWLILSVMDGAGASAKAHTLAETETHAQETASNRTAVVLLTLYSKVHMCAHCATHGTSVGGH